MSGPFQTISTLSSLAAFAAPAWTAFQNSCVVPLGTTAMRSFFSEPAPEELAPAAPVLSLFLQAPAKGSTPSKLKPWMRSRRSTAAMLAHGAGRKATRKGIGRIAAIQLPL